MRAFRNVPVLASVARDVAEVGAPDAWIFNYTNPAPVQSLAMNTVPGVNHVSLCSCTGYPSNPEWLAEQAGVPAGGDRDAADRRRHQPLRRRHRPAPDRRPRRAAAGRRARDRPDRALGHRHLRRAAVLLVALGRVPRRDAGPDGALRGRRAGARDALRPAHLPHGRPARAGSKWETLAAQWTAAGAAPVSLADLPLGQQDKGHRGDGRDGGDRAQPQRGLHRQHDQQRRDPEPAGGRHGRGAGARQPLRASTRSTSARCPTRSRRT